MITKEYLQQELAKRIDGYKRGVETTTDNIIAEMKSILVLVDALLDYEKKYNDALAWMRELYPGLHGATKEDAEHYFPELRESEDERTRNELIGGLMWQRDFSSDAKGSHDNNVILPGFTMKVGELISWLEKQKEQKSIESVAAEVTKDKESAIKFLKSAGIMDDNGELAEMYRSEPKPAEWSEEDERLLTKLMTFVDIECFDRECNGQDVIDWLKSLRPQPKHEWTTYELNTFANCCILIGAADDSYSKEFKDECIHFLMDLQDKSLRPSWKPSKKQMKELKDASAVMKCDSDDAAFPLLKTLYEQLEKL